MKGKEICLSEIYKYVVEKKNIVLAGSGANANEIITYLKEKRIDVLCFCDNAKEKQGTLLEGIEIMSFQEAVSKYAESSFVITVSNGAVEMRNQLLELGIPLDQCYICLWGRGDEYYRSCSKESLADEIKLRYEFVTGKKLDFENVKSFNEKIRWMMAYDSNTYKTRLTDKILVRDWIKEQIGEKYLVPVYGTWYDVEEIPFDKLPDKYVLKTNHGCGWNIIVTDKNSICIEDIKGKLKKWLNLNFAFRALELHYKNITPSILCEEYMTNTGEDIYDYKVWCFNGKAYYIQFLSERKKGLKMAFYDTEWKRMPFVYEYEPLQGETEKPAQLNEMLRLSEILSKDFPFVRVDWYILNDGTLKFGEMTFTPAAGLCNWQPECWDKKLGDILNI